MCMYSVPECIITRECHIIWQTSVSNADHVCGHMHLLVFSKCFRAGYFTFSQLKFKVNKGINV